MVVTVFLGVVTVTVDGADDVAIEVTCCAMLVGTGGAGGSVSSQTVFLRPRRLRSLPL